MRQQHVDAVDAERIAVRTSAASATSFGNGRRAVVLFFAFAFLEGIEVVEDIVAHFFEIFGDLRHGIFFLQLFDEAVDQHRGALPVRGN